MTAQDDISHIADRLRDALSSAATVMTIEYQEASERTGRVRYRPRVGLLRLAGGPILPLAAAACVAAVAVTAAVVSSQLHRSPAGPPATGAASPPAFYLVSDLTHGRQLQVRRTSDSKVTAALPLHDDVGSQISATASGRTFFVVKTVQGCSTRQSSRADRFYRITITRSGQVSAFVPVGIPVRGTIDGFAAAPDESRIAYRTWPGSGTCTPPRPG